MHLSSRFDCPSASLILTVLLKGTQRLLAGALLTAIGAHLSLALWHGSVQTEGIAKPLTTRFVKREPRLTKPLELKKRPRPKRRAMERRVVALKARTDRLARSHSVQPVGVLKSLAKPKTGLRGTATFADVALEPSALSGSMDVSKDSERRIDMGLEMMDVDALDTGRYHAMVIVDPTDKHNIKGFFRFYRAYSETMRMLDWSNDWSRIGIALAELIDAVNRYTDIRAEIAGIITFNNEQELLKTPWTYAKVHTSFQLTDSEIQNLGRYFVHGGFLFFEPTLHSTAYWSGVGGDKSVRETFKRALEEEGFRAERDWGIERIPNNHPIYHCYFDFDSLPLVGFSGGRSAHPDIPVVDYLDGVYLGRRMVGIVSNAIFQSAWGDVKLGYRNYDNTRHLQFGVNLIVFALTQEGSITNRVMDAVR